MFHNQYINLNFVLNLVNSDMKSELYIDIIQNLIDTNNKEDLKKKWSKIGDKFDDIHQTYIRNTAMPFILRLIHLQNGFEKKKFTKNQAFDICKMNNKKIFNNEGDLKKVFDAYTIHFAIYCKENPQDVKNVFGITS